MNNNTHPCANKCSEYKAEQCKSCLIQETKVQGVYVMGKADYMGDDAHIDKKKQCELLQTEVARLNATIERQKAEMVVMQVQINELTAENAGLHQAATTHFRNQNHYQNEVVETQAEKLLSLRDEKAELQKRVDTLEKAEFKLAQVKAILQNNPKLLESILVKKIEQALKGEQP